MTGKFSSILVAVGILMSSWSAQAAPGALLELVPVDVSHRCSVNILRGTGTNQNVAYVLPRMVVGKTEDGYPMIEFYPRSRQTGKHPLYIGVEFPSVDEEVATIRGNEPMMIKGCDVDTIRSLLNERETRLRNPGLGGIDKIVPVQVRWIEAEIVGVGAKAQMGDPDTRLLDTQTKNLSLIFQLSDEQKSDVTRALRTKMAGLVLKMNVHFEAQEEKGKFSVKLDVDSLVTELKADLKGKVTTNTALAGHLLALLKSRSAVIEGEVVVEGQVDMGLVRNIIDRTLDQMAAQYGADDYQKPQALGASASAAAAEPAKDVKLFYEYSGDGNSEMYRPIAARGNGNPAPPIRVVNPPVPKPPVPNPNPPEESSSTAPEPAPVSGSTSSGGGLKLGPEVDVDTFLRRFANKLSSRFSMVVMGSREAFTYGTEMQLRYSFADPFNRVTTLKAGVSASVLAEPVMKGDTFQFRLLQMNRKKVQYETKRDYYSSAEIKQEGEHLAQDFPFLMSVGWHSILDLDWVGGPLGVAHKALGFFKVDRRVYGEEVKVQQGVVEEKMLPFSPERLSQYTLALGFSKKPLLIPLEQMKDQPEWYDVNFDKEQGIMTIKANQDLGLPFMVNTAHLQAREDFEVRHFEQVLTSGNRFTEVTYKECAMKKKLPVQWTIIYVGVDSKDDDGAFSLRSVIPRQIPVDVMPPANGKSTLVEPHFRRR